MPPKVDSEHLYEVMNRLPDDVLAAEQRRLQDRMAELNSRHETVVRILIERALEDASND